MRVSLSKREREREGDRKNMSFCVCFFSTKRILLILLMVFSLAHQMESKKGMVRRRRVEDPALIASIQRAIKEVILPEPCDRECATKILKDSKHRVMRDEITFFTIMEGTFLFLNWIFNAHVSTHTYATLEPQMRRPISPDLNF